MMILLMILASATAAQPKPPAGGHFSHAEVRTMCRGETEERAEFRTDAAFRLLASVQRSKCRAYLLGVADGILMRKTEPALCLSADLDREVLADRLMQAVLSEAADSGATIPDIVEGVLRGQSRCP